MVVKKVAVRCYVTLPPLLLNQYYNLGRAGGKLLPQHKHMVVIGIKEHVNPLKKRSLMNQSV
jgi:hypothetical protein